MRSKGKGKDEESSEKLGRKKQYKHTFTVSFISHLLFHFRMHTRTYSIYTCNTYNLFVRSIVYERVQAHFEQRVEIILFAYTGCSSNTVQCNRELMYID